MKNIKFGLTRPDTPVTYDDRLTRPNTPVPSPKCDYRLTRPTLRHNCKIALISQTTL